MKTLKFTILGIPFAKQSFRFTRSGRKYQPAKVVNNEQSVRLQVINQIPKPFKPFSKHVEVLSLTFVFPALKSFKKADRIKIESGRLLPKTTRPDVTDNLMKGLFDAMSGVVFTDDALVWKMNNISKVYGQTPCILIEITGE